MARPFTAHTPCRRKESNHGTHHIDRLFHLGTICLDPYNDGWQIRTAGGRKGVRRGRDASVLGALGVVDIKGFRTWLQRTFRSLTPPPPQPLRAPMKDAPMRDVPEAALAAGGQ